MIQEQIWQNAFYNALSTVAQTLAAAFGILAAFMLFRFQHAEGEIKTHGQGISESVSTLEGSVAPELIVQLKEADPASVETTMEKVIEQATVMATKRRWGKRTCKPEEEHQGVKSATRCRKELFVLVRLSQTSHAAAAKCTLLDRRYHRVLPGAAAPAYAPDGVAATLTAVAVGLALVCLTMYARLILLLLVPETDDETRDIASVLGKS